MRLGGESELEEALERFSMNQRQGKFLAMQNITKEK